MYSEHGTAGEPGAVVGVSGCWRVEGGLKGARSSFSWLGVACAFSMIWAVSDLHLHISIEYVRVTRFVRHCKVIFKRGLFLG